MSARRVIVEVVDSATLVATNVPTRLRMIASTVTGPQGATGPTGPTGPAGAGFPTGGATGTVLTKNSATNYDTTWATRATLAADSAWSSLYAPLTSARVFLPAYVLWPIQGSPAMGTLGNAAAGTNRTGALLYDAAAFEQASATFIMPPGWATFSTHLWWSNAGTGTGNVVWVHYNDQFSAGDTTDASPAGTFLTVAAPAQYVLARSSFAGTTAATPGQLVRVNLARSGTSGTDTLPNDAGLVLIELVRES